MNAPIINAFAYGPWFDQRVAFIVKDINDFKDEEILGIVTHELAHLKHKHTFLLLLIGWSDIADRCLESRCLLGAGFSPPQGILQYFFDFKWSIALYYVVNILIFAFMVVFVRIFEAQADRTTINAGYGKELGKSLYECSTSNK